MPASMPSLACIIEYIRVRQAASELMLTMVFLLPLLSIGRKAFVTAKVPTTLIIKTCRKSSMSLHHHIVIKL